MGEVGRAFVVLREGRPRLANYKVPRSVAFVAALPTNAAGKVVKHDLMAPRSAAAGG